jgi:chorismate synthase
VVPAAGVVAEAMVAYIIAQQVLVKFGGDSALELKRNYEGYLEQIRRY